RAARRRKFSGRSGSNIAVPSALSDPVHEDDLRLGRFEPQRFGIAIVLRVIPALRLLKARKFEHHHALPWPDALECLHSAAADEIAPTVFLNRSGHDLTVLFKPSRVSDVEVSDNICRHVSLLACERLGPSLYY